MKIDVAFTPAQFDHARGIAVVLDVLRATSSIAALLGRGAPAVYPVARIEDAEACRDRLDGGALLCGEEGGLPPSGFDHGNSPWEFARLDLASPPPPVVLATTNGTSALLAAAGAPVLFAGALLNAGAVVAAALREAMTRGLDVTLVCAGERCGAIFALEDAFAAGVIVARVLADAGRDGIEIERSDAAEAALLIGRGFGWKADRAFRESEHGRELMALGFADDIAFCAQSDRFDVAPRLLIDGPRPRLVAG